MFCEVCEFFLLDAITFCCKALFFVQYGMIKSLLNIFYTTHVINYYIIFNSNLIFHIDYLEDFKSRELEILKYILRIYMYYY